MADSPPVLCLRRNSEDGVSKSGGKTEGRVVFAEISSERAFFCLPALNVLGIPPFHAEVVELVDTLGSGSSEGSFMGVRVSPSAPFFSSRYE